MDIAEFKDYLAIDRNNLDEAVIQQPQLYFQVGEAHAMAIAERDATKEDLAFVDAGLRAKHRKVLEKAEMKVTEGAIEAGVIQDPEHMNAFDRYTDSKRKADELWALKESFGQRMSALEVLARLYASNYFAKDSMRTDKGIMSEAKAGRARVRLDEERRRGRD